MSFDTFPLGRRASEDDNHVRKYGLDALPEYATPFTVNKTLKLPSWHHSHDQVSTSGCVGHGGSMERAIVNTKQDHHGRRYDPIWLWNEAKKRDEWADTNPGDNEGTSVRAAYDVLRTLGHVRVKTMQIVDGIPQPVDPQPPNPADGVLVNRWATNVDQMRACLAREQPVTIGINWYTDFDVPDGGWIARYGIKGYSRGGHCVCVYGASDHFQAFRIKNSWGAAYPQVWIPYTVMTELLGEDGEAVVVTDK